MEQPCPHCGQDLRLPPECNLEKYNRLVSTIFILTKDRDASLENARTYHELWAKYETLHGEVSAERDALTAQVEELREELARWRSALANADEELAQWQHAAGAH